MLNNNTWNHLIVWKQMIRIRFDSSSYIAILETAKTAHKVHNH